MLPTPTYGLHNNPQVCAGGRYGMSLKLTGALFEMLPTPTVKGNHNRAPKSRSAGQKSGDGLATAVGGSLHPRFVEWMMGAPPDWTLAWMTPAEIAAKRAAVEAERKTPRKRATRGASARSATPSSSKTPK